MPDVHLRRDARSRSPLAANLRLALRVHVNASVLRSLTAVIYVIDRAFQALRLATVTQLTEVIGVPSRTSGVREDPRSDGDQRKNSPNVDKSRGTRENPAFSDKDEA